MSAVSHQAAILAAERVGVPAGAVQHPLRGRGWLMRRLLVVADLTGLVAAFLLGMAFAPANPAIADRVVLSHEIGLFLLSLPFWVLVARIHGLYDRDEERSDHSTVDDFFGVFQVVTIGTWSFLAVTHLLGAPHPTLPRLVAFWVGAIVLVPLTRAAARLVGRRRSAYVQNVIIVGSGEVARTLADKIAKHPEYGLNVLGFVDRDAGASLNGSGPVPLLGSTDDLSGLVRAYGADRVMIAFSTDSHEQTLDVIRLMQGSVAQIDIVPRMFEVVGANAQFHTIEGLPLVGLRAPSLSKSSRFLKRSLDLAGAVVGLVLLSPLLLGIALWIKLDSPGPVFFRQVRMGAGDRTFRVYKFRTMVNDAEKRKAEVAHLNMHRDDDPRMFKIPNDPRVTRLGGFLRRSRIDELPQLINVVRGEMSLVGPRPLILEEDRHIVDWGRKRLRLRPGITGLWQVLGASDIRFDEMVKLDYLYVTNWSLAEDIRLIFRTFGSIARARRAY